MKKNNIFIIGVAQVENLFCVPQVYHSIVDDITSQRVEDSIISAFRDNLHLLSTCRIDFELDYSPLARINEVCLYVCVYVYVNVCVCVCVCVCVRECMCMCKYMLLYVSVCENRSGVYVYMFLYVSVCVYMCTYWHCVCT